MHHAMVMFLAIWVVGPARRNNTTTRGFAPALSVTNLSMCGQVFCVVVRAVVVVVGHNDARYPPLSPEALLGKRCWRAVAMMSPASRGDAGRAVEVIYVEEELLLYVLPLPRTLV